MWLYVEVKGDQIHGEQIQEDPSTCELGDRLMAFCYY